MNELTLTAIFSVLGFILSAIAILYIITMYDRMKVLFGLMQMQFNEMIVKTSDTGYAASRIEDTVLAIRGNVGYLTNAEENRPKGNPLNFYTINNQSGAPIMYFYQEVNRDEFFNGMKQTYKARFKKGMKTLKIED